MAKLKPCPLCGNPVHITQTTVNHYSLYTDYLAKIECGCGLTFEKEWIKPYKPMPEVFLFNEDIVTLWNRRAEQ